MKPPMTESASSNPLADVLLSTLNGLPEQEHAAQATPPAPRPSTRRPGRHRAAVPPRACIGPRALEQALLRIRDDRGSPQAKAGPARGNDVPTTSC
jgi:hypothetical protein